MSFKNKKLNLHVQRNSDSQSIAKGLAIYKNKPPVITSKTNTEIQFEIPSDTDKTVVYRTTIENYNTPEKLKTDCSCPFDWGGMCKHRVAALMVVDGILNGLYTPNTKIATHSDTTKPQQQESYDQKNTSIAFSKMEDWRLLQVSSKEIWKKASELLKDDKIKLINGDKALISLEVTVDNIPYSVRFEYFSPTYINTVSDYADTEHLLSAPKVAALRYLSNIYGEEIFESFKDFTEEKNKLLAPYGFSLADDLKNKFDFKINRGKIALDLLDKSIARPSDISIFLKQSKQARNYVIPELADYKTATGNKKTYDTYIYALNFDLQFMLGFELKRMQARKSNLSGFITKIVSGKYGHGDDIIPIFNPDLQKIQAILDRLETNVIYHHLQALGFDVSQHADRYGVLSLHNAPSDLFKAAQDYHAEVLYQFLKNANSECYLNISASRYSYTDKTELHPIFFVDEKIFPRFVLLAENELLKLNLVLYNADNELIDMTNNFKQLWFVFFMVNNKIYRLEKNEQAEILKLLNGKTSIKIHKSLKRKFIEETVLPIGRWFPIENELNEDFGIQSVIPLSPVKTLLYLKENDSFLLFIPAFKYEYMGDEFEVEMDGNLLYPRLVDGNHVDIERDSKYESEILSQLKAKHPKFDSQTGEGFYYLNFSDVLADNWYFDFIEQIRNEDIEILGQKTLQKFKYSTKRPKMNVKSGSGTDWFDFQLEVHYDDEAIPLAAVRKAILNKQNYISLSDGTLGLLPKEWLEKYAGILRLGNLKGENLKVSKRQFGLLDGLEDIIDNQSVIKELNERKQKLKNFKEIKNIPLPEHLQAELRHYQLEGFKWLHFLDEFGWGGCLADDMGLGKTLQVLTFLQDTINKNPDSVSLVILPTTLVFNWCDELLKFCPNIKFYVHRGTDRSKQINDFKAYNLILTTYGMVRSDIDKLVDFKFHYIILDEAQAIKNPSSVISKAVKQLNATNRISMTGTPVENNTFDLYSQIDFLNPGMLGSEEFFKNEYANAIDKHRDQEKAAELRKLIYPFLLKRTKSEVAKDLPDKVESIIYCEMDTAQRKVYETYKNKYRQAIMEKVDKEGIGKSGFLILEGLLKLRQICDSPALLAEEADYGKASVKLDEITREIAENAGDHKILVFSQFLKMLDLIKGELEKMHISYEYLDGQTTDRKERVKNFQESSHTKVFLISLKAGGVGINLTEADYVYLVDPWWNPAVEQQAIDRTHRIGQKKKVFAYKMICKDTVEEKILKLQEQKKDLVNELISVESGFFKKLGRSDIENLFS